MVICPFAHISETAGWIYSISSFMDLPRHVVVHRHSYLPICPIWAFPVARNLSKQAALGPDFAENRISETTGWINTIWSSVELSRPVVVQHRGHLTLTLDFQGQILNLLYLRNGRVDWHGTKGMWVYWMLHPLCDFQCSLTHDLDLGFVRSNFEKVLSQEWDGRLTWN